MNLIHALSNRYGDHFVPNAVVVYNAVAREITNELYDTIMSHDIHADKISSLSEIALSRVVEGAPPKFVREYMLGTITRAIKSRLRSRLSSRINAGILDESYRMRTVIDSDSDERYITLVRRLDRDAQEAMYVDEVNRLDISMRNTVLRWESVLRPKAAKTAKAIKGENNESISKKKRKRD